MATRKTDRETPPQGRTGLRLLPRMLASVARAPAALALLWPTLLVVGGYLAWHQWGAEHVGRQFFSLEQSQIVLTEQPDYIRSDISEKVFATTGLSELSLLDSQATARVAQAYATHPWISKVVRVCKKTGGKLEIQVQYRQPVAMVLFYSDHPEVKGWAYDPIDAEGLVLPQEDFEQADTRKYLIIRIPNVYSTGTPGFPFGDSRVAAAARVAAVLADFRERFELSEIRLASSAGNDPLHPAFELVTQSGKTIIWGSAPGDEQAGERSALAKIKTLVRSPTTAADLRMASPGANTRR
ncbi:MAG: hypothetical protein WD119_01765, partial [Pirellulaceae bacterium]